MAYRFLYNIYIRTLQLVLSFAIVAKNTTVSGYYNMKFLHQEETRTL